MTTAQMYCADREVWTLTDRAVSGELQYEIYALRADVENGEIL